MQTADSQKIVNRFFHALDTLKGDKVIRGVQTFTSRYGINRRNLLTLRKQPERDIFQAAWLAYLVVDYGVSPAWLLTGVGNFYENGVPVRAKTAGKPQPQNSTNTTIR